MPKQPICLATIEALGFPCYVIDVKTYAIVLTNSAATHNGLRTGSTCHELTHNSPGPCSEGNHKCPLREVLETGKSCITKHIHDLPEGGQGIFEVHGYPIRNDSGEITHMVECSFNITDSEVARINLKEMEESFLKTSKLAELGEMASEIGHEIGNPLAILSGITKTLKKKFREIEETLEMQDRSYKRMSKILAGLKNYSYQDEIKIEEIDFHQLMESNLDLIEPTLKKQDIQIIRNYCETGLTLSGNYGKMQQVVMNLLNNAKDALESKGNGGEIRIETSSSDSTSIIKFTDTGAGIGPEKLDKIFNAFFTTKERGKGTGLGLKVVKNIVENMKGTISVDSKLGEYTTFTLTFPL